MKLTQLATFILCLTLSTTAFSDGGRKEPPVIKTTGATSVGADKKSTPKVAEPNLWGQVWKILMS